MGAFIVDKFYLFFQGVLVFQTLFLGILYLITRKKDILFYSAYLLFQTLYFFWNAPYTFFGIDDTAHFMSSYYLYVNTPLIIITNLLYIYFLKHFFTGLYSSVKTNRLVSIIEGIAFSLIIISAIFIYFKYSIQFIFYLVNFLSTIFSVYILTDIYKKKIPNTGWVVAGIILNIIGNATTIVMIVLERYNIHHLFTDEYPLFFMRCGILADIFFYLIAILKKWNYQEKQLAVQQIESQLAIEKVRNKISSQLHDDIGSTLSGVSMYSYMAISQLQVGEHGNLKTTLQTIQQSAGEVVNKLGDLVWSVKPGHDSMEVLVEKAVHYAREMCRAKSIDFTASMPALNNTNLNQEKRYHIYLCIKEAINNAVKYSNATLLKLDVKKQNTAIEISLTDNGDGFEVEQVTRGNGLNNMQQRAMEMKFVFLVQSKPGSGTCVRIKV
jgi:signal transduction histidine kinase